MFFQVVLIFAILSVVAFAAEQNLRASVNVGDIPCHSCTDLCTIIPPPGTNGLCYQGTLTDTKNCYLTDPLLPAGAIWQCDTCVTLGYPNYVQNDPLYKTMGLWKQ